MTMRATRPCRWTALAASVAAACAPFGSLAAPAVPASPGLSSPSTLDLVDAEDDRLPVPAGAEELYLEVSLNQSVTGQLARFLMLDGRLHASAATLRGLGLQWPGSDDAGSRLVALDAIPGLQARYDAGRQHLALTVPLEALSAEREHFGPSAAPPPRVDPASRAPGLLLNYDLYAQGDGDYRSVSGWHELRLFGLGPGLWSNSMVSRATRSPGTDDNDTVRLDTAWRLDLQDSMVSVIAGDTYTGALQWTRPTRIGGVRVARDFALQPYRVTTPLASFAGEAALPSTVDLFIDGIRQSSQQVRPGQFQIDSLPRVSGAGQAQMVITDINGQSRVVDFSLYSSAELLQAGLSDWSLEAGLVRRDYGLRSFAYADEPMASATLRHGVNDLLTVEAHAEGTAELAMAGAGAQVMLGRRGGVLDLSLAGSRHEGRAGRQYGGGWQWASPRFNLALSSLRRDAAFADVASLEDSPLARRSDRAFAGVSLGRVQIGASYLRQDRAQQPRARYANLSLSWQLPRAGYLSVNLNRDLEREDSDHAYLYWSMPLDRRTSVSASARHASGTDGLTVEANRSVDYDRGGWGWRAQASAGDAASAQAEINRLGAHGEWAAGVHHTGGEGGRNTGYASASGSVVLMQGHLFGMRRVDDAFALVSTDGIADVPILLENRLVGRTDAHGLLLVSRLNAWQNNRLSIDPLQAPADVSLDRTELLAVPESRSGMLARFPMRPVLSLQVGLTGADGRPLAAGSPVWLHDADPASAPPLTVVGYDGLLYLEDPPADARLRIGQNGGFCEAALPSVSAERGLVELQGVVCR